MKRLAFASCALSLCWPALAQAGPAIYPGCSVPAQKAGFHTFYVDPVKGSASGNGSAAKPWRTLSEVLGPNSKLLSTQGHKKVNGTDPLVAMNPSGPIKAGDVIMLMSGDHGAVKIVNAFNADFVTVMAAPGQTPVISRLETQSAAKWVFQGIKFQGANPAAVPATIGQRDGASLVALGRYEYLGAGSDLVFVQDTFSTSDNTSGWSAKDWLLKPYYYAIESRTPCVSVSNSRFYNLLNGFYMDRPKVLFQANTIDTFSNDGIDLVASDVTIKGNTIKNNNSTSLNPWHPDGIQGWSFILSGVPQLNTNVVIDGNTVLKTGDPNVSFMQGITVFDGKWDGLTIQNNVVVTNHWHGITVYGAKNLKLLNNTVVASEPIWHASWIRIDPMKTGAHTESALVRNNVSPVLVINDTGVTYDHNTVSKGFTLLTNGKAVNSNTSNTALQNIFNASLNSQFVTLNLASNSYDLRLKSGSSLIGTGTAALAPILDIAGKKRSTPTDLGAYTH